MSRHWRWFLPAYVLLAPFALVYVAFLYVMRVQPTAWCWHEGVLTVISKRGALPFGAGGQGWSWVVAFADEDSRQAADLRVHEFTHVTQEFACSMVGLVAIIVLTLCGAPKIGLIAAFAGTAIFHVVYATTYAYAFVTKRGHGFTNTGPVDMGATPNAPRWFCAYMSIPWEVHAYDVQDGYQHGLHAGAWGSSMLH